MGFLAKEIGVEDVYLLNVKVFGGSRVMLQQFECKHEPYVSSLYVTNDDPTISDSLREKQITELGHEIGVNFSFIN